MAGINRGNGKVESFTQFNVLNTPVGTTLSMTSQEDGQTVYIALKDIEVKKLCILLDAHRLGIRVG